MKIDFHNHYYPPEYLAAVKKGPTKVRMDYDAEGNPRLHYPGDYNILVPGHRDLDYREGVLKKHGVDKQVITFTTPGHAFRRAGDRRDDGEAHQRCLCRRGQGAQAFSVAGDAAAERSGGVGVGARAGDDHARPARRDGVQQRQRRGAGRQGLRAAVEEGERARRRHLHSPRASARRRGDGAVLADAARRLPDGHDARGRASGVRRSAGALSEDQVGALPHGRRRPVSCRALRSRLRGVRGVPRQHQPRAEHLPEAVLLRHGELRSELHRAGDQVCGRRSHPGRQRLPASDRQHPEDARCGQPVAGVAGRT